MSSFPGSAAEQPRVALCSQITHIFYDLKVLLEGGGRSSQAALIWIHVLLCVRVSVCIQISAVHCKAKHPACVCQRSSG